MDFQPDNEMQRLYERFVNSLSRGADFSAYSEDDLLDIYDYTRSIPDDYIALEVLIAGSRMYPGSADLAKRKVLFFHDFEQDRAVLDSASTLPADSLVRIISRLKVDKPSSPAEARERLLHLLAALPKRSIEDGDIYFLIETFNDIGLIDVISDASSVLAEYCAYPTTLDQELYKIYSDKGNTQRAISHCQALTVSEPFEAHWWEELANAYANLVSDKDAALEAADYALALNPDAIDVRLLKATLLAPDEPEKSAAICDEVLRLKPDYRPALFLGAYIRFLLRQPDEACRMLRRYAAADDESVDRNFFEMLFENLPGALPDDFSRMLQGYVDQIELSEAYLWALSMSDGSGSIFGAIAILEALSARPGFAASIPVVRLLLEAYYRTGQYDQVIRQVDALPEAEGADDLIVTLFYALSRYHTGATEGLADMIERRLTKSTLVVMEGLAATERNMMLRGVRHHLVSLMKALLGDEIPPQAYDPFAE